MANLRQIYKSNLDRFEIIRILEHGEATCKGLSIGLDRTVFSVQTSLDRLHKKGYINKRRLDGRTWIYSLNHHNPYPYKSVEDVNSYSKSVVSEHNRNAAIARWESTQIDNIEVVLEKENKHIKREKVESNPHATIVRFGKLPKDWNVSQRMTSQPYMPSISGYLTNFA